MGENKQSKFTNLTNAALDYGLHVLEDDEHYLELVVFQSVVRDSTQRNGMNKGKEPPISLCEKKFLLDAIKENKVPLLNDKINNKPFFIFQGSHTIR